jgi:hypothetical protein
MKIVAEWHAIQVAKDRFRLELEGRYADQLNSPDPKVRRQARKTVEKELYTELRRRFGGYRHLLFLDFFKPWIR